MNRKTVYVFDTSALSRATEDMLEAVSQAYRYMYMRSERGGGGKWVPSWRWLRGLLRRRAKAEYAAKALLTTCDENICIIPRGVWDELSGKIRLELSMFLPDQRWRVAERMADRFLSKYKYIRERADRLVRRGLAWRQEEAIASDIARMWRANLRIYGDADKDVKEEAEEIAEKFGISEVDAEAVALAKKLGATLVTADRGQAVAARRLGVPVINLYEYTPSA